MENDNLGNMKSRLEQILVDFSTIWSKLMDDL